MIGHFENLIITIHDRFYTLFVEFTLLGWQESSVAFFLISLTYSFMRQM